MLVPIAVGIEATQNDIFKMAFSIQTKSLIFYN